ncbi:hypothetical protein C8R45DRAFT_927781 [Mycena sanguinolenta]|nr:hypothetical protein C8R45DRAFT_927781 [Mycena sanguinolenta]
MDNVASTAARHDSRCTTTSQASSHTSPPRRVRLFSAIVARLPRHPAADSLTAHAPRTARRRAPSKPRQFNTRRVLVAQRRAATSKPAHTLQSPVSKSSSTNPAPRTFATLPARTPSATEKQRKEARIKPVGPKNDAAKTKTTTTYLQNTPEIHSTLPISSPRRRTPRLPASSLFLSSTPDHFPPPPSPSPAARTRITKKQTKSSELEEEETETNATQNVKSKQPERGAGENPQGGREGRGVRARVDSTPVPVSCKKEEKKTRRGIEGVTRYAPDQDRRRAFAPDPSRSTKSKADPRLVSWAFRTDEGNGRSRIGGAGRGRWGIRDEGWRSGDGGRIPPTHPRTPTHASRPPAAEFENEHDRVAAAEGGSEGESGRAGAGAGAEASQSEGVREWNETERDRERAGVREDGTPTERAPCTEAGARAKCEQRPASDVVLHSLRRAYWASGSISTNNKMF